MSRLQAVLCDMDGTLVDTEPYWETAKLDLTGRYDVPFTHADVSALVGRSMKVTVDALRDAGVPLSDEEILDGLVEAVAARVRAHIPWLPGAQEFLQQMVDEDVPCALVTQAWAPVAEVVVAASNGALQTFVSGGDVTHPKPHPEPYLTAAARLGVDPTRCVAIEDSPSGVESAEAAGAVVIVLPGIHPVPDGPRRIRRDSLVGIDRGYLESLL
ncbi:MAG: HAD family phosphatase [Thermomicrobiales bacterium]|nr:HAD family phosphatase [Thermomicrobiales bacterium]MCO5226569.1 HAD family phosphatase [Thermomicrobiales bacterium]